MGNPEFLDDTGIGRDASGGDLFYDVNDPLDIWGTKASENLENISNIAMGSANEGIAAQQYMIDQTNAMYKPYEQAATGAWGDYTSMAAGGQGGQMPMSPQYQMEMGRNTQAINRGMASRGGFNSSGRGAALGDAALMAGQSEAARQYGRQLDMQRMGTGAIQGMGSAGQTAGQNVGATYGNLGQNMNSMYQNYGAQRQDSLNTAGNAIAGAGQYMAGR